MDKDTLKKLETLRNLYFLDKDEDSSFLQNRQLRPLSSGILEEGQLTEESTDESQNSRNIKQLGSTSYKDTSYGDNKIANKRTTTYYPVLQREVAAHWSLGPEMSAEDAVQQFAPLFQKYEEEYSTYKMPTLPCQKPLFFTQLTVDGNHPFKTDDRVVRRYH